MLVGCLFILLFILGYTFWSYYVFRGKVRAEGRLPLVAKTGALVGKKSHGARRAVPALQLAHPAQRKTALPDDGRIKAPRSIPPIRNPLGHVAAALPTVGFGHLQNYRQACIAQSYF